LYRGRVHVRVRGVGHGHAYAHARDWDRGHGLRVADHGAGHENDRAHSHLCPHLVNPGCAMRNQSIDS